MAERMTPGSPPHPSGDQRTGKKAARASAAADAGRTAGGTARNAPKPGTKPGAGEPTRAPSRTSERKAVLNVTISESLAAAVRGLAAAENRTVSSVVERALAEQIGWERIRRDGLAAIDEYYRQHGYPTPEQMARAETQVKEEERLIEEAHAAMAAERARRRSGGRGGTGSGRGAA
jgi:Ribbon-helix-helix protein, copG family